VHALVLSNGLLALAYNHHTAKEHKDGTRTNLTVAVSHDRGRTWRSIAQLENAVTQNKHIPMFQSPTMYQRGCFLFVAYSVRVPVPSWLPPTCERDRHSMCVCNRERVRVPSLLAGCSSCRPCTNSHRGVMS
jgi:hypothetical protein